MYHADISPAKILAPQRTISENDDLYVTCSTFGKKKDSMAIVYLLKDGKEFRRMTLKQDQIDVTFKISKVNLNHNGNYTCVHSPQNYSLSVVTGTGHNTIQIHVIANSLPADISVLGWPTVSEGDDVEFKCTFSDILHSLDECQFIYAYLWKNRSIFQVMVFDVAQKEASFTMEGAVVRDSGDYSCTLLPSSCVKENEKQIYGKNVVVLKVNKVIFSPLVAVPFGLIMLLLLFGMVLWWTSNSQ
ncbi:unnamed protein product, partial [Menidia menidia]